MELNDQWFKRAHEVLIGGQWILIEAETYWQHDNPKWPGPHPNQKGRAGWTEFNGGGTAAVDVSEIHGVKFDTLRGKLEGG